MVNLLSTARKRSAPSNLMKLAPLYSITSSAATSRPGGTVRPSAFAVLRFTTIWYLVSGQIADRVGMSALCQKRTNAPQQGHGYSITSSAVPSSVAGTSSPRTLAVCRLMTNSNFAARMTGRTAGFSPFRIRPI